jgi:uncharacterized protein (DUF302 family)
MANPGMTKTLGRAFDQAPAQIPEALKTEGFGVLTEIDVRDTLKQKLDVDFRRYRILGACNPSLAHQALSLSLDVGLMLPCNVIVYEGDDGQAVVTAVDPTLTVTAQQDPKVLEVAVAVRDKLARVLERLR